MTDWDTYEEYFCYDVYTYDFSYTVTMKDGTVYAGECWEIENQLGHWFDISANQSSSNPWGVGKHTVTIGFMGTSTEAEIEILENPIASVTATPNKLWVADVDGYYTQDWYTYKQYFRYEVNYNHFDYTVAMKDGSVYTGNCWEIESQIGCLPEVMTDQGPYNVWGIGTHTATVGVLGVTTEVEIEIIENPIASIEAAPNKKWVENMDGQIVNDDYTYKEYFCYDIDNSDFDYRVTMKDGSVYTGNCWEIASQIGYYVNVYTDQGPYNVWGIGTHTATVNIAGVTAEVQIEIVECPIAGITAVPNKKWIENVDGYEASDWDYMTETYKYYFRYSVDSDDFDYTVTMKDGTVYTGNDSDIYDKTGYWISVDTDQCFEVPWGAGKHTVEISLAGITTTAQIEIDPDPVVSVKLIKVLPLLENRDGDYRYDNNAQRDYFAYRCPQFVCVAALNDGTEETYTEESSRVKVECHQSAENPWTVGKNNKITVTVGNVSAEGYCEILPASPFEYIEQDGAAIIVGYNGNSENLVVPDQINGLPIVGVNSLASWENGSYIKSVTVPDSVKLLSADWTDNLENLEEINIGKGVTYLDYSMFVSIYNLKAVNVSAQNSNYASVDGVVYTKDKSTLVFYPIAKGLEYTVPKGVTDFSILYNEPYKDVTIKTDSANGSFVSKDGVLYSADMKTVIRCDSEKSGSYTMPASVTTIRDNAFSGCEKLTEVKISESVTDIVYAAFADCTALASVTLPSKLNSIGDFAFGGCTALKSISVPDSVAGIGDFAFGGCTALKSISVPDSVAGVGECAFSGCSSLKSAALGKNVKSIGKGAFMSCEVLTGITIPNGVTSIESSTFSGCAALKAVTIPSGVTRIGGFAFAWCNALTDIAVPDSVKSIENNAFEDCTSLTSAKIGNGVTSIGDYAFYNCSSLKSITIPSSVTSVGISAFRKCSALTSAAIGNGVKEIGDGAFIYCASLASVTIGNSVTNIGEYAFEGCESLKSVNIPDSVTAIKYETFKDCTSLSSIKIGSGVKKIGLYAFENTAYYNNESNWQNGVLYVDKCLIKAKPDVKGTYNVKADTQAIAEEAFGDCTSLTGIKLPDKLEVIDTYAFNSTGISQLVIPESVTDIGYGAFEDCTSLADIQIPDKLVHIEGRAFDNTEWLDNQPNGTVYLGRMAYTYKGAVNSGETLVIKPDTLGISDYAFGGALFEDVKLPEGLVQIGERAFNGYLTEIAIPESVTDIRNEAVGYCGYYNVRGFKIYGYEGSAAEKYAEENGIEFVALKKTVDQATGVEMLPKYAGESLDGVKLTVKQSGALGTGVEYSISVTKNGAAYASPNGAVIKLPLQADQNIEETKLYKVNANGSKTEIAFTAAQNGQFISFDADGSGNYVMVQESYFTVIDGDVNGDGKVSAVDARWALQCAAKKRVLNEQQLAAADMNKDGKITAVDARQILKKAAGKI